MSQDNKDNENRINKIVQLPFILLGSIVNNINDNIDKICFSLVCKRWYDNRSQFLLFNTKTLRFRAKLTDGNEVISDDENSGSNQSASFNSIYHKSLKIKSDAKLKISSNIGEGNSFNAVTICPTSCEYDFFMTVGKIHIASIVKFQSFLPNITYVNMCEVYMPNNMNVNKHLYEVLWSSPNVTEFHGCQTLKFKLPPTIKVLSFSEYFKEEFTIGCFPPGIEEIILSYQCKIIKPGILPEGLKRLDFGRSYQHPIGVGVIPSSVTHLTNFRFSDIDDNVEDRLPSNLESLHIHSSSLKIYLSGYRFGIVSALWNQQFLKSLTKLTTLSTLDPESYPRSAQKIFDLSELPPSITYLSINSNFKIVSAMPSSIKYLHLYQSKFNNEMFPDTTQYHLEELKSGSVPMNKPNVKVNRFVKLYDEVEKYPSKTTLPTLQTVEDAIKSQTLAHTQYLNVAISDFVGQATIPRAIDILDFSGSVRNVDSIDLVPRTVRTLIINYRLVNPTHIPPNITNIIIQDNEKSCHIRRLDTNYFLMFGWTNFISLMKEDTRHNIIIFHQDKFNEVLSKSRSSKLLLNFSKE
ncbi:hypothetical protein PPL_02611 [Heterostelium album PN500]|uniref:Uncharacterized protein n=1 Tax=Heterostelium pallidum (strain ATCC 26659 / Pp 5 / PN500) TaxID=670386 RepID=D3B2J8_HETP5|nr:hypothetical protein PPL_02611 [Heterostelium album PN500]EFA83546.1 hypothetical protein PPL_02611 [Heterostelium album PN500]|eukprot:XP_020435663.1 hypothetical protein PPL_02611 [Heterostelium album PN500]